MPRFYFHTRDGQRDRDEVGVDLPDAAAARRETIRYGGSLLSGEPDILSNEHGLRIDTVDGAGELCCPIIIVAVDACRGAATERSRAIAARRA